MSNVLVEQTKKYLVVKIPLCFVVERPEKKKGYLTKNQQKKAILDGLVAMDAGRVSKTFSTARAANSFLSKF